MYQLILECSDFEMCITMSLTESVRACSALGITKILYEAFTKS